jgi:diacylglycerol kinase (ATP)
MKKKIFFIINPRSGVDRVKAITSLIKEGLDNSRFDTSIAYTQYAGHGTELAKEAVANKVDIVAAVGGDGSVNDVIKGIYNTTTQLAIIPKGSGNGLARSLNIPLDTAAAIGVINQERAIAIDLGKANDLIFAANIGVGFDAHVAHAFAKSKRRGLAAYAGIVTKLLWGYKACDYQIEVDGQDYTERCFMLNVANAKQFGYNFQIAPIADLQDGQFDIILLKPFPKLLGLPIVLKAFSGRLLNSRYVHYLRGRSVVIRRSGMQLMQADGDAHSCKDALHIAILPSALSVLVPEN